MQSNITIIVPHHIMPPYHTIIIVILTSQVARENEEKQIPATNISFSEKLKIIQKAQILLAYIKTYL